MWYDYTIYGLEILNKIPTSGMRLACGKDWWGTGTGVWDDESLLEVCLDSWMKSFKGLRPERVLSEVRQRFIRIYLDLN